jgi:hypothetical protein
MTPLFIAFDVVKAKRSINEEEARYLSTCISSWLMVDGNSRRTYVGISTSKSSSNKPPCNKNS